MQYEGLTFKKVQHEGSRFKKKYEMKVRHFEENTMQKIDR